MTTNGSGTDATSHAAFVDAERRLLPTNSTGQEIRQSLGNEDGEPGLPQPHPPRVNLRDMEAIAREARKLYREARAGLIDISTATKLTFILQAIAKLHERSELEARIARLEALTDGRS